MFSLLQQLPIKQVNNTKITIMSAKEIKKWTDSDLSTAFEDWCRFSDLEELKDFLLERRRLVKNTESKLNIAGVNVSISVTELVDKDHKFFEYLRKELPHVMDSEDQDASELFPDYDTSWTEEDILNNMSDWIPFCIAQKMVEYGFDLSKYGYFGLYSR